MLKRKAVLEGSEVKSLQKSEKDKGGRDESPGLRTTEVTL